MICELFQKTCVCMCLCDRVGIQHKNPINHFMIWGEWEREKIGSVKAVSEYDSRKWNEIFVNILSKQFTCAIFPSHSLIDPPRTSLYIFWTFFDRILKRVNNIYLFLFCLHILTEYESKWERKTYRGCVIVLNKQHVFSLDVIYGKNRFAREKSIYCAIRECHTDMHEDEFNVYLKYFCSNIFK